MINAMPNYALANAQADNNHRIQWCVTLPAQNVITFIRTVTAVFFFMLVFVCVCFSIQLILRCVNPSRTALYSLSGSLRIWFWFCYILFSLVLIFRSNLFQFISECSFAIWSSIKCGYPLQFRTLIDIVSQVIS